MKSVKKSGGGIILWWKCKHLIDLKGGKGPNNNVKFHYKGSQPRKVEIFWFNLHKALYLYAHHVFS